MLTALDWAMVVIVGFSSLMSIIRGFVREAASILAWIAAFIIAGRFYPQAAPFFTFSQDELTRTILAILILFISTLLITGFIGTAICSLVQKAGLSSFDRLLGVAFGIVRGVLVLSAALALLQIAFRLHILSFITEKQWWSESVFIPELQRIVNWFFIYMGTPVGA